MKKLNNRKGFTLAELLIVVAIIGVLTVVAVPVFTTQLEKSREATDIANMREAKAAATTAYLSDQTVGSGTAAKVLGSSQSAAVEVYFDASSGKLTDSAPTVKYGKGTEAVGDKNNTMYGYEPDAANQTNKTYANKVIKIKVETDGTTTLSWE